MLLHSFMPRRLHSWVLALTLFGVSLVLPRAIGQGIVPVAVDTITDGSGLFTFTLRRGEPDYVWGIGPNSESDTVFFPCYGVEQVFLPAGWRGSISNEIVSIGYIGGPNIAFLDGVTFSVRSAYTNSILYDGANMVPGGRGITAGVLHSYPDLQPLAGGFVSFPFIGPAPVPEPSVWTLLLMAGLVVWCHWPKCKKPPASCDS